MGMVCLDATAVPRIRDGCLERSLGTHGLMPLRRREDSAKTAVPLVFDEHQNGFLSNSGRRSCRSSIQRRLREIPRIDPPLSLSVYEH